MVAPSLRLLFLGTPEFAVPSLRALAASHHSVVGVISQPDRPRGRGRKLEPTPTKELALELGLPLLQPEKVGEPDALDWMRALAPDVAVVVAFGQFIPKSVRELPRLEMINAHASLLPRWRGAAPIQWAIAAGDARTGISVMRVAREMDAGDVCLTREIEIGADETGGELFARLAYLAAAALLEAIDQIAEGRARFVPQDPARATEAPKVDRAFARVDWRGPADRILWRIRAATPWPGVDVRLASAGKTLRILRAGLAESTDAKPLPLPVPGAVRALGERLLIGALDAWVQVFRIQAPGRRPVDAAEFLRGSTVSADERIAPEAFADMEEQSP